MKHSKKNFKNDLYQCNKKHYVLNLSTGVGGHPLLIDESEMSESCLLFPLDQIQQRTFCFADTSQAIHLDS